MTALNPMTPTRMSHPAMGQVRVRTLLLIRWLAIAGQLMALLLVDLFLEFELPMNPALGPSAPPPW
ncbi:MAG: hypothetical protein VCE75_14430 [Alphaproteobacteria bacterium]